LRRRAPSPWLPERTTRSGLLQELTEREVSLEEGKQRRRIDELLAGTGSYDGQAAAHIREMRDSR